MNDHSIVTMVLLVQLERVLNTHTHVCTYTTLCNELYRVFNMIGSRYNQIDY